MEHPLFSIIIPTLNEELFLPNLLASLASQTHKNFEVFVVDGASRDKTVALARDWVKKLPKLEIIASDRASLPHQRNLGAGAAHGEWLIFVDADSIFLPYSLERIVDYIGEAKPKMFSTWAKPDSSLVNDAIMTLLGNIYWESTVLLKRPVAPGPLTIIRKDVFESVGGYDETHEYNEDVDLGLRLSEQGVILNMLRETLYVWSMRRIRREGKVKQISQYILAFLPILLFRRPLKHMPGYIMGGHLYKNKKPVKRSVLKIYERKLKQLMKELVG